MVRSPAEGGGRVFIEEVAEVIGESFTGAEKVFIVDDVLYREPMKLDEDGGDAVS